MQVIIKIVDYKEVENLSRCGWTLVTTHVSTRDSYYPLFQMQIEADKEPKAINDAIILANHEKLVKDNAQRITVLQNTLKHKESDIEQWKEAVRVRDAKGKDLAARIQLMEADLGKLRSELGDIRMREILGK